MNWFFHTHIKYLQYIDNDCVDTFCQALDFSKVITTYLASGKSSKYKTWGSPQGSEDPHPLEIAKLIPCTQLSLMQQSINPWRIYSGEERGNTNHIDQRLYWSSNHIDQRSWLGYPFKLDPLQNSIMARFTRQLLRYNPSHGRIDNLHIF